MKTNIALICLLNNYSNEVAELLSEKLEMFFVDVDEMVEFELGDAEHINETLGDQEGAAYIKKCEDKVVSNVAGFENTIISLSPTTMFSGQNYEVLSQTSYVIYLQIAPKFFEKRAKFSADVIDKDLTELNFTDCDKLYVEKSDMMLNCSTFRSSKAVSKLTRVIKKFFKKTRKAEGKHIPTPIPATTDNIVEQSQAPTAE